MSRLARRYTDATLTHTSGSRLGTYEITAPLGAGGMGEVYRARDTKLERDVAIKVLPADFAENPERVARFEREAKSLAALNHPNVATLFGFEQHDEVHFLVMELVEGEDLADHILRGPIQLDEAIPLFIQIAEGLEAAHERGIVHRDLKPANIKVSEDGRIKILDFGLAKAMESQSSSSPDLSQSPTMTAAATARGEIMGTAAYMSPEQAKGRVVDRRTDVWSFGCCLFEVLTGKRPFAGDDAPTLLASVLKDQPNLEHLPTGTPVEVIRLLRRSLEKDRNARLQHIGDARVELAELLTPPATAVAAEVATPVAHRQRPRSTTLPWVIAALAVAGSLIMWFVNQPASTPRYLQEPIQLSLQLPAEIDIRSKTSPSVLQISNDGSQLVVVGGHLGARQLWRRELSESSFSPVEGTAGVWAGGLGLSPDGEWALFHRDNAGWKVRLDGGNPIRLTNFPFWRPQWASDDHVYMTDTGIGPMARMPAVGGPKELVLALDESRDEVSHSTPTLLPGGYALLFYSMSGSIANARVEVANLTTGERLPLIDDAGDPAFVKSGHIVFNRDSTLWAVPFDVDALRVTGPEVPVVADIETNGNYRDLLYSVSPAGALAYVRSGQGLHDRRLVRWSPSGDDEETLVSPGYYGQLQVTPDGTKGVISMVPEGRRFMEIFSVDLESGARNQLTFDQVYNDNPVISNDGSLIVFTSNVDGNWNLYSIGSDGGNRERLTRAAVLQDPTSISPDTRFVAYREGDGAFDLWALPLDDESREPIPIAASAANEHHAAFSPDGQWIAYTSVESGRSEIWVQRFDPEGGERIRRQVSQDGGWMPVWHPDGRSIFFRSERQAGSQEDVMMSAAIRTQPTLEIEPPQLLFAPTRMWPHHPITDQDYVVLEDGSVLRFVAADPKETTVNVILNFDELLRRDVPTG